MSDQWMRAGGAAWLDAVLYDDPPSETGDLLADPSFTLPDGAGDPVASGLLDRTGPASSR